MNNAIKRLAKQHTFAIAN